MIGCKTPLSNPGIVEFWRSRFHFAHKVRFDIAERAKEGSAAGHALTPLGNAAHARYWVFLETSDVHSQDYKYIYFAWWAPSTRGYHEKPTRVIGFENGHTMPNYFSVTLTRNFVYQGSGVNFS